MIGMMLRALVASLLAIVWMVRSMAGSNSNAAQRHNAARPGRARRRGNVTREDYPQPRAGLEGPAA
jgi:hypothetical protein